METLTPSAGHDCPKYETLSLTKILLNRSGINAGTTDSEAEGDILTVASTAAELLLVYDNSTRWPGQNEVTTRQRKTPHESLLFSAHSMRN
jgi:hypothetical protein